MHYLREKSDCSLNVDCFVRERWSCILAYSVMYMFHIFEPIKGDDITPSLQHSWCQISVLDLLLSMGGARTSRLQPNISASHDL